MTDVQIVIFNLGDEEYAVDIMQVKEIVNYLNPVKVPNTPEFIEGIINLRSEIIPIINLKKRFNIADNDKKVQTRIMVMNIDSKKIGFVVDDASEVISIRKENIEPAPDIVAGVDRKYISGIGKKEDRILIILELDKLFSEKEYEALETIE